MKTFKTGIKKVKEEVYKNATFIILVAIFVILPLFDFKIRSLHNRELMHSITLTKMILGMAIVILFVMLYLTELFEFMERFDFKNNQKVSYKCVLTKENSIIWFKMLICLTCFMVISYYSMASSEHAKRYINNGIIFIKQGEPIRFEWGALGFLMKFELLYTRQLYLSMSFSVTAVFFFVPLVCSMLAIFRIANLKTENKIIENVQRNTRIKGQLGEVIITQAETSEFIAKQDQSKKIHFIRFARLNEENNILQKERDFLISLKKGTTPPISNLNYLQV
ncbi:hypothetical protein SCHIN_v1c07040 [Spiroplasma chinense]|uniref:Uncharacterized protein n=1 Tax=Spiroplasma chinense TaxID=216932 RepID=A0A5B9Y4D7_9MOLU|nr:hypothetical protein [Spiroplasma chinense]QEH61901.1 hypothetical protein SCHIN_v1c07040 [Spiroplasma chinense]